MADPSITIEAVRVTQEAWLTPFVSAVAGIAGTLLGVLGAGLKELLIGKRESRERALQEQVRWINEVTVEVAGMPEQVMSKVYEDAGGRYGVDKTYLQTAAIVQIHLPSLYDDFAVVGRCYAACLRAKIEVRRTTRVGEDGRPRASEQALNKLGTEHDRLGVEIKRFVECAAAYKSELVRKRGS